jgi:hypothetical protein
MRVIELLEIDRNGVKECDGDMSKGIRETGKEDLNINSLLFCFLGVLFYCSMTSLFHSIAPLF